MRHLTILCTTIMFFHVANGQRIKLKQSNENGVYKDGQVIRIVAVLKDRQSDSLTIKVRKDFSGNVVERKVRYTGDSLLIFNDKANNMGSIIVEVSDKKDTVATGLIIYPERFKPGTARPEDFDLFGMHKKKALRSLPFQVKSDLLAHIQEGYTCANVEINCTGPRPARGYLAKPSGAKTKSLPIVIYLHAAGVSGAWCRSEPVNALKYAQMGNGRISFDLNAHGMLNGQPEAYYKTWRTGS